MIFIVVGIIFIVSILGMSFADYYGQDIWMVSAFLSFVALVLVGLFGTIPLSSPEQVYSRPISHVNAYSNPNGGTVLTFVDNGKTYGVDEGGDNVTLTIANNSRFVKQCNHSLGWLVPWTAHSCSYIVYAPGVNLTPLTR